MQCALLRVLRRREAAEERLEHEKITAELARQQRELAQEKLEAAAKDREEKLASSRREIEMARLRKGEVHKMKMEILMGYSARVPSSQRASTRGRT
jgi:hypothetical protein